MRSFFAKVEFTDAKGTHPAGTLVNVPYDTDEDIANAMGLIRYGVITDQAPPESLRPNQENPVVAPVVQQAQEVVLVPNEENAVDVSTTVEQDDQEVATDDPETPFFDARDDSGKFVPEGTPVEAEAPAEESTPAPKKRASRKR